MIRASAAIFLMFEFREMRPLICEMWPDMEERTSQRRLTRTCAGSFKESVCPCPVTQSWQSLSNPGSSTPSSEIGRDYAFEFEIRTFKASEIGASEWTYDIGMKRRTLALCVIFGLYVSMYQLWCNLMMSARASCWQLRSVICGREETTLHNLGIFR